MGHSDNVMHTYGKSQNEKKSAFVVIFSAITMVLEIIFGIITNSMALLADGIHMGSHILAIGLSWAAYVLVRKLKDRHNDHYDTDRILSLTAFTSGLMLLIFSVFIVVETLERFFQGGREIQAIDAIIVAVIGLVVNGICALVLNDHHSHNSDLNRHSAFLHVLADALTSIGAILGLICALIWDITWVDTAMALILSIVILKWAKGLLWETARTLTKKS